ncbi:MAG: metallophosphoesterase [Lachnospiraceae bacterium]|nr:metallophosphoesterase [Lachnospiraceae bacterium]
MLKWMMLAVYILLSAFVLGNAFVWYRKIHVKVMWKIKLVTVLIWIVLASSIMVGKVISGSEFQRAVLKFGNYWLAFFIYAVFFIVVADLIILILWLIRNRFPKLKNLMAKRRFHAAFGGMVILCTLAFTVYGAFHAEKITTSEYNLKVNKKCGNMKELNLVLISDLHLGYSIGCKEMRNMVDMVNDMDADIIVIAGDIFDNEYEALGNPDELIKILSGLKSKMGTYAVYGNHDVEEVLVGGFPISSFRNALRDKRMDEFLEKCNINVLEDESVIIDNSFYLVGRLDGERTGYGTMKRKSVKELTENLDKEKPLFFINHEPNHLDDYEKCGTDIVLSGHTHAGQFFPLTIVQPFAWENYWGVIKKGDMYSAVTSGIGVYGPDIRVFTDSEIMKLKIEFN